METHNTFSYNLPSIPGKSIRLKVQPITKKGFSSNIPKHSQNYSEIANSFISEYSNLRQKRTQSLKQEVSTKPSNTKREQPQAWYIIPQHKGTLINLYEEEGRTAKPQNYKMKRRENANKHLYADFIRQKKQLKRMCQQMIRDEQHKLWNEQAKQRKRRKFKPSPCFISVPRQKQVEQDSQQEYDEYQVIDLFMEDYPRFQEGSKTVNQPSESPPQIKQLIKQTEKMLQKVKDKERQPVQKQLEIVEEPIPSYMFIKDDRDRFGDQMFPIAAKLNVPGPGSYKQKDTLENKAKRVRLLQEQRKILKQWFND